MDMMASRLEQYRLKNTEEITMLQNLVKRSKMDQEKTLL
jgi:hypothetical protein